MTVKTSETRNVIENETITNLKAEGYIKLKSDEKKEFRNFIDKQIKFNESLEKVYRHKTQLVEQEKQKYVYEHTEPEYHPFYTYCWEVVFVAGIGLSSLLIIMFKLPILDATQLKIYAAIISIVAIVTLCALFFPILILPKKTPLGNMLEWFRERISRRNRP